MKSLTINQKIGLVLGAILLTAFFLVSFSYRTQIASAFGVRYLPSGNVATTTPYQSFAKASAGSFSTTTINSDGSESLSLFVMIGSSTTPPVLSYRVQYSPYMGIDCATNGDACTWYDEDSLTTTNVATSTTHNGSGVVNVIPYASTTANQTIVNGTNSVKFITKRIDILNLNSTYTRIVWLNGSGGDVLLNVIPSFKNTIVSPK